MREKAGLIFRLSLVGCAAVLVIGSPAAGEEGKKERALPKSGVIAGSTGGGHAGLAVDEPWGGTDIQGKDAPPISGSVSRLNEREWSAKIVNNTEDRYTANMALTQYGLNNRQLKTDYFAVSLRAKETLERRIAASPTAAYGEIALKSWRRFEKPKTREELSKDLDEKKGEVQKLEQELQRGGSGQQP